MLTAYIIVIACTLILFSFVTRSLQGKAARLNFSQSMLPRWKLEYTCAKMESGRKYIVQWVRTDYVYIMCMNEYVCFSVENYMYIILMLCVVQVGP